MTVFLASPETGVGLKIEIPFGSSDIKALMSYYVGVRAWSKGSTYSYFHEIGSDERELSPIQFHTVLSNTVGKFKKPLTFSFYKNGRKHFEPIVRFESSIRFENNDLSGKTRYLVTTDYWSVLPIEKSWESGSNRELEAETLRHSQSVYRIDSESGESEWLDGVRPSSIARMTPVKLSPEFQKLGELYEAASDSE